LADILEIKNLNKKFGGVIATKDLNLSISDGELHAIIGPNGAGKTTLISQIFGQIFPDSGQIFFQDINVTKVSEYKKSRLGINRTFQITSVMKSLTVSENIQLATKITRENSLNFFKASNNQTTILNKIDFCLRQVGLIKAINQPVTSLSHGDCSKLEIAMALASDAQLLLLDEPMAGLGPTETKGNDRSTEEAQRATNYINNRARYGRSVCFSRPNIRISIRGNNRNWETRYY